MAENEGAEVVRIERAGQKRHCPARCRRGSDSKEPKNES